MSLISDLRHRAGNYVQNDVLFGTLEENDLPYTVLPKKDEFAPWVMLRNSIPGFLTSYPSEEPLNNCVPYLSLMTALIQKNMWS